MDEELQGVGKRLDKLKSEKDQTLRGTAALHTEFRSISKLKNQIEVWQERRVEKGIRN